MPKWEYAEVRSTSHRGTSGRATRAGVIRSTDLGAEQSFEEDDLWTVLRRMGEAGWELVSHLEVDTEGVQGLRSYMFKRALPADAE
jgi:hypothetical protein